MRRVLAPFVVLVTLAASTLWAQTGSVLNTTDTWYRLVFEYEKGYVKVLHHTIQFGTGTTEFDYVQQGGQEILFPFDRFTARLNVFDRHQIALLYQPFTLETQTRAFESLSIDDVVFPAGTSLRLKYGFPFYRVSYLFYPILDPILGPRTGSRLALGAGLSLQFRNASIIFQNQDGAEITISQNLGPVPILKLVGRLGLANGMFFETEIDGFYASSRFFNGADFEFEGSILDASLRTGLELPPIGEAYLNARFIGGSAAGTSNYQNREWTAGVANATKNYLATLAVSIGVRIK